MFSLFGTFLSLVFMAIVQFAVYIWYRRKSLRSIKDRHIVVTVGSSGIGLWTAADCVKLGAHVTIIGFDVEKLETSLEKIKQYRVNDKQKIQFRAVDLSTDYGTVESALSALEEEIAPIYMLINAAGESKYGHIDEMSPEDAVRLMNINYFAVYYPTRYVLEQMKKAGEGIITIIGSKSSLFGMPGFGPYSAAEFALRGLAESLAMEVSDTRITVTFAVSTHTDAAENGRQNGNGSEGNLAPPTTPDCDKLEHVANHIVQDSLSRKSFSSTRLEIRLLMSVWKAICPLQSWQGTYLDKRNAAKALIARHVGASASESLPVEITSPEPNAIQSASIEQSGVNDQPNADDINSTVANNTQAIPETMSLNVTKSISESTSASDTFSMEKTANEMSSAISTPNIFVSSSTHPVEGGLSFNMPDFMTSKSVSSETVSILGTNPKLSGFSFNVLKSTDKVSSKTTPLVFDLAFPKNDDGHKSSATGFCFGDSTVKSADFTFNNLASTTTSAVPKSAIFGSTPSFSFATPVTSASSFAFGKGSEADKTETNGNRAGKDNVPFVFTPSLGEVKSALSDPFGALHTITPESVAKSTSDVHVKQIVHELEDISNKIQPENNNSVKVESTTESTQKSHNGNGTMFSFNADKKDSDASQPFKFEAPTGANLFSDFSSASTTNHSALNRRPSKIAISRRKTNA